jgi:hypothetical protein
MALMAKGELWNDTKGRAIELVLSSCSLRYARVVFTMEGKGSAVPERDRSQFETNFFSINHAKTVFQMNLFSTNESNSAL